jgi:isocitrate lyase
MPECVRRNRPAPSSSSRAWITAEDPGPDLASYPLSQVPDEAAGLVRALLTADKNQQFARSRMDEETRRSTPDFRPFIIADADTGHGGDAHVRNLIRRFVEVGVPGYHIEDQKPGAKKCGHQSGKVLVGQDEQNKRLNAARLQLDIMGCPASSSPGRMPRPRRSSITAPTSETSRSSSERQTWSCRPTASGSWQS